MGRWIDFPMNEHKMIKYVLDFSGSDIRIEMDQRKYKKMKNDKKITTHYLIFREHDFDNIYAHNIFRCTKLSAEKIKQTYKDLTEKKERFSTSKMRCKNYGNALCNLL